MPDPFLRLADRAAFGLFGLTPGSHFADAVHFFVEDTVKIFVLMAAITFLMGLFRSVVSPHRVRAALAGRSRGASYLMAVSLGAVTPFCSCSSVPLFIGFLEGGVPVGATMAFLIASPMINEVAVVLLGVLLGWPVAALYVGTGMAVGVLGGWLADRTGFERHVESFVWTIRMGAAAEVPAETGWRARLSFATEETRKIVGRVWPYVLIGVALGAGLHGYVPEDFVVRVAGPDNPLAVPLAVLLGIPLYSSATGIIPVAEALLGKGMPVGTVLALMMSTVAISLPEFVILRRVVTAPGLVRFAAFLGLAFTAVGVSFNLILS
jgi:uncharacterized membrane protein YraQ (UPF0718 family)